MDSGAFIQRAPLHSLSADLVTVPEVLSEIRDGATLRYLEHLRSVTPLATREPSDDALRAVSETAKQTGDFGALSRTDLRVLALAHQLHKERPVADVPSAEAAAEKAPVATAEGEAESDGEGEWVTPDNLDTVMADGTVGAKSKDAPFSVGCISGDYAIQVSSPIDHSIVMMAL